MPTKNKPKRFDRNRKFQVARRKMKQKLWLQGKGRSRKKRPKHKNEQTEEKKETVVEKKEEKVE